MRFAQIATAIWAKVSCQNLENGYLFQRETLPHAPLLFHIVLLRPQKIVTTGQRNAPCLKINPLVYKYLEYVAGKLEVDCHT